MSSEHDATIAVVGLDEIMVDTPRLLAWGAMLQVPYRTAVKLVVEIADMLPPTLLLSDYDIDVIKDAIGYVYDDQPDWVTPSTSVETLERHGRNLEIVTYEFEDMVIKAAQRIRQILGGDIVECHYVDLRQSRYIVMEVSYAQ